MDYQQQQKERETWNINEMTEFQKGIVGALKDLGFKYKYNKTYQLNAGSLEINVGHIDNMKEFFQTVYKMGEQEKVWEIKRVLEV